MQQRPGYLLDHCTINFCFLALQYKLEFFMLFQGYRTCRAIEAGNTCPEGCPGGIPLKNPPRTPLTSLPGKNTLPRNGDVLPSRALGCHNPDTLPPNTTLL